MRTAIFTAKNDTILTINILADEVVDLVQMGKKDRIARLSKGTTNVKVQAGIFRLISEQAVQVTPAATDVEIVITPENKGDWPDLKKAAQARGHDSKAVGLFLDAKSITVE